MVSIFEFTQAIVCWYALIKKLHFIIKDGVDFLKTISNCGDDPLLLSQKTKEICLQAKSYVKGLLPSKIIQERQEIQKQSFADVLQIRCS